AGAGTTWKALDLVNLLLMMVPAAVPIALGAALRRTAWPKRETALALALVAPWLIVACVASPAQGVFRDLDFYAPGAVAIAVGCAGMLGRLTATDGGPRLAAAVSATCVGATLQVLFCFHEPAGGLARVRAYLSEPPERSAAEHASAWDFLALRAFAL